jgi:RsiW-degrading membrane proteinase PrsW (M82 family)
MALLVLGGIASVAIQDSFRAISASGWLLSWGLLLLYAIPVFAIVYLLDLYEREPLSLVIGALLWGALVAPLFASIGNSGWGLLIARVADPGFASQWTPALTAPVVEEIVKAAGVVMLYLIARDEFDDMMDGFVYGAIVGLGFTVVEDIFYFMGAFGGRPDGVLVGFFLRVVASGLYGHVLYTGLTGMAIARYVTHRDEPRGRRLGISSALFLTAMFGHFLWNSPLLDFFPAQPWTGVDWALIPVATAIKGLPLLGVGFLAVRMARRREERWLVATLQSEVERGGMRPEELETLASPKRRRAAVKEMRARAGKRGADLLKRLHRQLINLAMVATRVDSPNDPDLVRQRVYCTSLRNALHSMPGATPAAT